MTNFAWKLSRWPFQKSVAVALDKLQCRMTLRIVKCIRHVDETIDHYDRRRKREARNLCTEQGTWSNVWCNRVTKWDAHIRRSTAERGYDHLCSDLLQYHDSRWLLMQRSNFVTEAASAVMPRNSLAAGRTGTRLNIGRPQPRWGDGVILAQNILNSRTTAVRGNNAVTVGTVIRETVSSGRAFLI